MLFICKKSNFLSPACIYFFLIVQLGLFQLYFLTISEKSKKFNKLIDTKFPSTIFCPVLGKCLMFLCICFKNYLWKGIVLLYFLGKAQVNLTLFTLHILIWGKCGRNNAAYLEKWQNYKEIIFSFLGNNCNLSYNLKIQKDKNDSTKSETDIIKICGLLKFKKNRFIPFIGV